MNDRIPYDKFERQIKILKRAGFDGWQDFQQHRLARLREKQRGKETGKAGRKA